MPFYEVATSGFTTHRNVIADHTITELSAEITQYQQHYKITSIRQANAKIPAIHGFALSSPILTLASQFITSTPQLVRAIVFDKSLTENWYVTWHQDKTIAVNKKHEIQGWGPWSLKEGVHHVQPDFVLLNNCITLRCHLDDSDRKNGGLQVIPESHRKIWSPQQIQEIIAHQPAIDCEAKAGDIFVMRPLLIHASKKAEIPSRRRIIHLEFCGSLLPEGLSFNNL